MTVSAQVLNKARKLRAGAVRSLLVDRYPLVCRLAHALTGRTDAARKVVHHVMVRSVRVMQSWRSEEQAEHWFGKYTIQTARRSKLRYDDNTELLLEDGKLVDAPYRAFVRALRSLPPQQQEAFFLHHGEKLNPRYISVAMDSSTEATQMHLRAAEQDLKLVAGEKYDEFVARIATAYAAYTPRQEYIVPQVQNVVLTRVWPRRIARWIAWLALLSFLAGLAYLGYLIYPMLEIA